jgi:hypothetical protein
MLRCGIGWAENIAARRSARFPLQGARSAHASGGHVRQLLGMAIFLLHNSCNFSRGHFFLCWRNALFAEKSW